MEVDPTLVEEGQSTANAIDTLPDELFMDTEDTPMETDVPTDKSTSLVSSQPVTSQDIVPDVETNFTNVTDQVVENQMQAVTVDNKNSDVGAADILGVEPVVNLGGMTTNEMVQLDDETDSILPEEPVLNRDNPPEADQTLEEILDAATGQDDRALAEFNSEALVVNQNNVTDVDLPEKDDLQNQDVATEQETTAPSIEQEAAVPSVEHVDAEASAEQEAMAPSAEQESVKAAAEHVDTAPSMEQDATASCILQDIATATPPTEVNGATTEPAGNETTQAEPVNVDKDTTTPAQIHSKTGSTFNLGVPGLTFSANNVKTAKDGTKMVQIHQSQITPEQLSALQNNPNIKVVFRHVPSGKSYSKPPRHMLSGSQSKKRKATDELDGSDVYSFDDGEELWGPAKSMKFDSRLKFSYGGGKKKGKNRVLPDSGPYAMNYMSTSRQSGIPAKVMLTDLLARVNSPRAKKEIRVHTSQINAEVLANMELNPYYRIVLTTKQELPPLVIENVDAVEQAKLEEDAVETDTRTESSEKAEKEENMEIDEQTEAKEAEVEETEEEKQKRLEEEEKSKKQREAELAKKLAEEEEELKKTVMQTQRSRSGRIRKPSKYALDIARLTKRKSTSATGGESSGDETEDKVVKAVVKTEVAAPKDVPTPPRGRGRPRKNPMPQVLIKKVDAIERIVAKENAAKTSKDDAAKTGKADTTSAEKDEAAKTGKDVTKTGKDDAEKTDTVEKVKEEVEDKRTEKVGGDADAEITKPGESKSAPDKSDEVVAEKATCEDKVEKGDAADEKEEKSEGEKTDTAVENLTAEDKPGQDKPAESASDAKKNAPGVESSDVKPAEAAAVATEDKEEENEVIDNKYRLRKLLEQCSTEEIRSVLLPEAFDSINLGDFLLYKAGQTCNPNGKISFPKLYREFEALHGDAFKEATRYNTLVKRANKVGGDKRMEKIVLMPVYNIEAANSLQISSSSIDAHICGIQRTITTEMIAANSFFIKSKMETPLIRLKLPEATAPKNLKPKQTKPLYMNQHQQMFTGNGQQEPDTATPDRPKPYKKATYGQKIASMKYSTLQTKSQLDGLQVRWPAYLDQLKNTGQITVGGMSHQISSKASDQFRATSVESSLLRADVQSAQVAASATSALAQLQATVQQQQQQQQASVATTRNVSASMTLNPVTGELMPAADSVATEANGDIAGHTEQYFVTEDGVPISAASTEEPAEGEVRKHLVPIGDGQYVELPEGYSLIQTDEGYIIGQPGSTFTQGEDGNVYITNSDGTTTEITREDIAGAGEDGVVTTQETEG